MSTTTQNDYKTRYDFITPAELDSGTVGPARRYTKQDLDKAVADARKEVIDSIHNKFCEFAIQGGDDEQAQKGIMLYVRTLQYLATLRKEQG